MSVLSGNNRNIIVTLPTNSIASAVTDPPHHLCRMRNPSGMPNSQKGSPVKRLS